MEVQWFRQDRDAVVDALRRRVRPLMATTTASGQLIALHIELGVFEALDQIPVRREWQEIDAATAHCRTTLTLLAYKTAQVYRGRGGQRLAKLGIRRLRRQSMTALGRTPVVLFMDDCYGVMPVEERQSVVGFPIRQGLLPAPHEPNRPCGPI